MSFTAQSCLQEVSRIMGRQTQVSSAADILYHHALWIFVRNEKQGPVVKPPANPTHQQRKESRKHLHSRSNSLCTGTWEGTPLKSSIELPQMLSSQGYLQFHSMLMREVRQEITDVIQASQVTGLDLTSCTIDDF